MSGAGCDRLLPRVLWVTGNFLPEVGGLQVYIDRLLEMLAPHCRLALITAEGHQPPREPSIRHFPVRGIGRPGDGATWARAGREVAACVAAHAADVVHFASANVAVYRPVMPNSLPVVATVHGNDLTAPWQLTPGYEPQTCIVAGLNGCARVVAVSRHTAILLREAGVSAPVTIMMHGCDTDFFRPRRHQGAAIRRRYGIDEDCPVLLTVARLVDRKGHATIIEALRRLAFKPHWLVVGDGPIRAHLVRSIAAAGLAGRVTLTGQVSDHELPALYNACDAFVLVAGERSLGGRLDSEGFGLVFLEAAACGKPVIGSDVSGCRDAIADGETGMLVPPDDPSALAAAISALLRDPDAAAAMGARGLAVMRAAGGWGRVAEELTELYAAIRVDARSERALLARYRV
jgi:phosphatidylinositol alpha-1,6-mannosyltransferase